MNTDNILKISEALTALYAEQKPFYLVDTSANASFRLFIIDDTELMMRITQFTDNAYKIVNNIPLGIEYKITELIIKNDDLICSGILLKNGEEEKSRIYYWIPLVSKKEI